MNHTSQFHKCGLIPAKANKLQTHALFMKLHNIFVQIQAADIRQIYLSYEQRKPLTYIETTHPPTRVHCFE
jgi:hypothetical protein